MTLPIAALIVVGALAGDIIGSAAKRRAGLERGATFWPFDQLGFIVFALLFAAPLLVLSIPTVIFIVILTLFVHWLGNQLGYAMRVKKVPW
jgi:CDP-2,3-bis-(O-geranylgeranyl)-sn-glycerol synthase